MTKPQRKRKVQVFKTFIDFFIFGLQKPIKSVEVLAGLIEYYLVDIWRK